MGRALLARSLAKALSELFANRAGQTLLEQGVRFADYMQGVGAGAEAQSSGELAVLSRLTDQWSDDGRALEIFDVGSNQGQFLKLLLDRFKYRNLRAHAFEPGQAAFRELSSWASGTPNVTVNNLALGRVAETRELFYDEAGSELASLTKRRLDHFGIRMKQSEMVQVETLDRYCAERSIEHIDLLKLDVEGHELEVLHGGAGLFRRGAIHLVSFEFGGCNIDSRTFLQDFYYFFAGNNMRIARVTPAGYLRQIDSYREILERFRTTNFVGYLV